MGQVALLEEASGKETIKELGTEALKRVQAN